MIDFPHLPGFRSLHQGKIRLVYSLLLVLLLSAAVLGGLPVQGQGVSQKSASPMNPFGVIESFESPDDADTLGAGWTRIEFNWARAQAAGPESWTPKLSDEQIAADIDAGREVVGLLIGIPDWARDEDRLPSGLWLPHGDPDNLWASYVRQVVTRYKGEITHWIIWNEPDIRETEIAHSWDGTVADFAQLQRIAYLTAKEIDPEAVIHLAAFTYWADVFGETEQYMALLLDEIMEDAEAAEHNYYFDVATAHLYFQPEQVYDLLTFFTDIMRDRGLEQPIWLVETNAPPKDDPSWPVDNWFLSVTLGEQAAYIPQALASAMAAGAERIAVYKLRDNEDDRLANPEPFGLIRADGFRRPAFDTYQVAIRQLSGAVSAERQRWDEVGQINIGQVGRSTTVLFSRLPGEQIVQIEATADSGQLMDMWGELRDISPVDGFFEVELPGASCSQSIGDYCMIGGLTYYLIQDIPIPPTPTATATSPPTPTPVPSPTPTATPSPTVELTSTPAPTETPPEPTQAAEEESPTVTATQPTMTQDEGALELSSTLGLWFLGGGILLAAFILGFWILRGRRSES